MEDPQIGDVTAWIVSMPGPDIDYAICIDRREGEARLRYQVYQQGPWHEDWTSIRSSHPFGCWKTDRIESAGENLAAEKSRLFPDA